jgi:hypothetical protein
MVKSSESSKAASTANENIWRAKMADTHTEKIFL